MRLTRLHSFIKPLTTLPGFNDPEAEAFRKKKTLWEKGGKCWETAFSPFSPRCFLTYKRQIRIGESNLFCRLQTLSTDGNCL